MYGYGIPGKFIALLTFPGVIVHEMAHQLICRLLGVAVYDVCYFQYKDTCGYVSHEHPVNFVHSVFISIAPFFVNTLIGTMIGLPATIATLSFETPSPLDAFLIWLGFSILMHAFPSRGDAECIMHAMKRGGATLSKKAISYPIVGLIYCANFASCAWGDLFYAFGVLSLSSSVAVGWLA